MDRIREQDGLSYGVSSVVRRGCAGKVRPLHRRRHRHAAERGQRWRRRFKEELARIVRDGFTEAELASVKKEILDAQLAGRSQDTRLATSLAQQARYGWTMQRTEDREKKIALTLAQVNAAARKWIDPASFAIFKAGDFTKK